MKRLSVIVAVLGVILLTGCHDRREGVKSLLGDGVENWGKRLPYDSWNFSFIYPKELPALVTMVYLEDGDIRENIFRRLDPMDISDLSVGRWHDLIGGNGGNFNRVKALPVRMTVCWESVIDKKAYETEIWFGQETWQQMLTAYPDTYHPGKSYYRNRMAVGLAPGGVVRVWLEDHGNPSVLQVPARQFTLMGDDMMICKNVPNRIDFNYIEANGYDPFIRDFIKGKHYPYGNW